MKAKFIINKLGAQEKSPSYDTYLEFKNGKSKILDDIASRLLNTTKYDIEWKNERAIGRLIFLETDTERHYISLSQLWKNPRKKLSSTKHSDRFLNLFK